MSGYEVKALSTTTARASTCEARYAAMLPPSERPNRTICSAELPLVRVGHSYAARASRYVPTEAVEEADRIEAMHDVAGVAVAEQDRERRIGGGDVPAVQGQAVLRPKRDVLEIEAHVLRRERDIAHRPVQQPRLREQQHQPEARVDRHDRRAQVQPHQTHSTPDICAIDY
jgi:hypothetical protein